MNRKSDFIEFFEKNDMNQVNQIIEAFKVLFKKFLFLKDEEEVGKFINSLEISKEEKKLIFQIYQQRKVDLQNYFKNSTISSSYLSDFDWKLQVKEKIFFFFLTKYLFRLYFQVINFQISKNQFYY